MTSVLSVISDKEGTPPCFSPGDPWVPLQVEGPGGLPGESGGQGRQGGWTPGLAPLTATCLSGLPTVVKLVDRDTLLKEREEKKKVGERTERT